MKTCCLINHYNYGQYVEEAVQSALWQTVPFHEVLLVDDGSTDGSCHVVERLAESDPRLRLLCKDNGGQLSCFNEGFEATNAEVVCFLDADDAYEPGYLEAVLDVYRRHPEIDFVFCNHRKVTPHGTEPGRETPDRDLGFSILRTMYLRQWVGAPTSCISARRRTLEKILPYPLFEDWITRADDCLVFGSSLAGARKYHLGKPLVRYRIHGNNRFQGRGPDPKADYVRRVAISRLFAHMIRKMGYGDHLDDLAHREFRTITEPTRQEYRVYKKVVHRSGQSLKRRVGMRLSMAAYYYFRVGWG